MIVGILYKKMLEGTPTRFTAQAYVGSQPWTYSWIYVGPENREASLTEAYQFVTEDEAEFAAATFLLTHPQYMGTLVEVRIGESSWSAYSGQNPQAVVPYVREGSR